MTRLFTLLLILAFLVSLPVLAQDPPSHGRTEASIPPPTAQPEVTLAEAMRGITKRESAHKGRKLMTWVRQRAEKHLHITVR